ncbi:MAG: response regulator transcription factor, partial [Flavobacteriales bacterium]|nr:response regulator transcription factor [Flavobacteriales bacterium]
LSNCAKGYILKCAAGEILIEAIRDLYQGGSTMSISIAGRVMESFQMRKSETDFDLTLRECEILDLLAQGNRNKQIAEKLFLSPHTIRTHIYNIYEKLHVKNRVEAINKVAQKR